MSGSRKISELTTATVIEGSELLPIVQGGETRQTTTSALMVLAPVRSVNGLTGEVLLGAGDIDGLEPIVVAGGVSAQLAALSVRVDTVSALASGFQTQIDSVSAQVSNLTLAIASVSVRVDNVSSAITSVQAYLSALISVAASGTFTEPANDGQIYGRTFGAWVPVSVTALGTQINTVSAAVSVLTSAVTSIQAQLNTVSALTSQALEVPGSTTNVYYARKNGSYAELVLAYDVAFDFGVSTVPTGEYAKIVTPRTFYILPSCSNSRLVMNTSAFPTAVVSLPLMYPTSVTLGVILVGVSGTATWPAISTVSVSMGETIGIQTSTAANANLKGLSITLAGYYRPIL